MLQFKGNVSQDPSFWGTKYRTSPELGAFRYRAGSRDQLSRVIQPLPALVRTLHLTAAAEPGGWAMQAWVDKVFTREQQLHRNHDDSSVRQIIRSSDCCPSPPWQPKAKNHGPSHMGKRSADPSLGPETTPAFSAGGPSSEGFSDLPTVPAHVLFDRYDG